MSPPIYSTCQARVSKDVPLQEKLQSLDFISKTLRKLLSISILTASSRAWSPDETFSFIHSTKYLCSVQTIVDGLRTLLTEMWLSVSHNLHGPRFVCCLYLTFGSVTNLILLEFLLCEIAEVSKGFFTNRILKANLCIARIIKTYFSWIHLIFSCFEMNFISLPEFACSTTFVRLTQIYCRNSEQRSQKFSLSLLTLKKKNCIKLRSYEKES